MIVFNSNTINFVGIFRINKICIVTLFFSYFFLLADLQHVIFSDFRPCNRLFASMSMRHLFAISITGFFYCVKIILIFFFLLSNLLKGKNIITSPYSKLLFNKILVHSYTAVLPDPNPN